MNSHYVPLILSEISVYYGLKAGKKINNQNERKWSAHVHS